MQTLSADTLASILSQTIQPPTVVIRLEINYNKLSGSVKVITFFPEFKNKWNIEIL